MQNYEAGLKALQGHKYDKAKACLEKVLADQARNWLTERRSISNSCNQHINTNSASFKNPEEQFDYAVSLMNFGDYVSAREIFER